MNSNSTKTSDPDAAELEGNGFRYVVLKYGEFIESLSDDGVDEFNAMLRDYNERRRVRGKPVNSYWVVNRDEIFADDVKELIDIGGKFDGPVKCYRNILGLLKTFPEWQAGEWAGDKEGWGFNFEFIKWMHRELHALRLREAKSAEER